MSLIEISRAKSQRNQFGQHVLGVDGNLGTCGGGERGVGAVDNQPAPLSLGASLLCFPLSLP